jgi:hypothetical protein
LGDVVGRWEFVLEDMSGECSGAAAGGALYVSLPLPSGYEAGETELANWGAASWGFDPADPTDFHATGNVRPSAERLDLRLWKSTLSIGSQLVGEVSDGEFAGVLHDPAPGLQPNFVLGSCTFPVTGHRLSSTP